MDTAPIAPSAMARIRPLTNPPITEALVDIKAKLSESFDPHEFAKAAPLLAADYPRFEERRLLTTRFSIGPVSTDAPAPAVSAGSEDLGILGAFFFSSDAKQIVQFRCDGFTLNRLAPYLGWESLRREVLRQWAQYQGLARIESILRIGLRTINRLVFDAPIEDISVHLTQPMSTPPGAPTTMTGYLQRVVSRDAAGTSAIVTHALEPDVDPERIALILDVAVFMDGCGTEATRDIEAT